ncbi:MAG: hypothetical protein K8F52_08130 [Candidatus Scalindua rubra]|nr:hypothetical protein [Candidatus Scalindua rubra]TWU38013.1 hypothetical protein S225a_00590 [Candidatus Brocadiaceae bacterium S225]
MGQKQPLNFCLKSDEITRKIFWCLLGFEFFIVFLDVFINHYEWSSVGAIRRMVNITREDSLSNWFSSIQAITVGAVIWLTAICVRKQMRDDHYMRKFYCWAGIGTFFIYLGIDDAIKFHERMGTAYHVLLFDDDSSNEGVLGSLYDFFPSYTWQMVFGPFLMVIGIFIVWFLRKALDPRSLWYWFLVGMSLYAVAIGLDYVEGLDSDQYEGIAAFFSTEEYRIEHLSKTLEEFLEMLGTTIFLVVFLKNIFGLSREWKINVVK